MGINELVRSKGYKNFMSKLYGIGAAIVILGALFKINHYPGAGLMLVFGMSVEAIIFIFSAFEPLHEEYDWSLVYPELAGIEGEGHAHARKTGAGLPMRANNDPLSLKLDELLANANIGPEVFDKLSIGLNNLTETTQNISAVADVVSVNNKYATELDKMTTHLSSLNDLYITQLKASAIQMETTSKLQSDMNLILENLNGSIEDSQRYRNEISALSQKVASLNEMYSKMLSAMGKS